MKTGNCRVAIVHDWLPLIGGAERVLEQITKVFPGADIFTLFDFLTDEQKAIFGGSRITPSYLNKLPNVKKYYRHLLPLFPRAIESFDLSDYDLIISSSYSVAKGVITNAQQTHISYVHSPARYAWDLTHQYLRQSGMDKGIKGLVTAYMLSHFRIWDYRTANGVDCYIANSEYIAKRIWKIYRRESIVIHPPVNVKEFSFVEKKEEFYLTASRMVPYKRIDLIAEAFLTEPDKNLVIIGDGPEMSKIRAIAQKAPNIKLMGYQSTPVLRDYMQRAKAFIFAAEEDFGIIPVEAQACGTPVIAYGAGGAMETVVDHRRNRELATGVFFYQQSAMAIAEALNVFESLDPGIRPSNCRKNAERFAAEIFREKLREVVAPAEMHQSKFVSDAIASEF
jgi:glycosyltransferase involved in cell wall biosynthesis